MITCYADETHFQTNALISTHYSDIAWPLHNHEYWEIQLCLDEVSQLYNAKKITSNPYDVFVFRPFLDSHQLFRGNVLVIKLVDSKFKEIADFISKGLYDALKSGAISLALSLSADEGKEIADFHSHILFLTDLDKFIHNSPALITVSTICILKHYLLKYMITPSALQTPNWLNALIKDLQNPKLFAFSLGELTADYNYSYMHISRLFKHHLNVSIGEFFLKNKLNYARNLLISTNMPLSKICLAVGYESAGHFNQMFKKHYGVTPREYRTAKETFKF